MLHYSRHNPPGLLEDLLVAPVGVYATKNGGQPIVIAQPDGVHGRETRLFGEPPVATAEALRYERPLAAELSFRGVRRTQGGVPKQRAAVLELP